MKIYLITCDTEEVEYDYYSGHVIVANNEREVIQIAKDVSVMEGKEVWDTAYIEIIGDYIGDEEIPVIILSSFHAE